MSSVTQDVRAQYHAGLVAEGIEAVEQHVADGLIPRAIGVGLRHYLADRIETGGFLRAVLENDFREAVSRAAPPLTLGSLKDLAALIYTTFPALVTAARRRSRTGWLGGRGLRMNEDRPPMEHVVPLDRAEDRQPRQRAVQQGGAYPEWICDLCAGAAGKRLRGLATFHPDVCSLCGETRSVTEPRDYGHLSQQEIERARVAAQQRKGGG